MILFIHLFLFVYLFFIYLLIFYLFIYLFIHYLFIHYLTYTWAGNHGNTIDGQFVKDDLKDEADGEDERFIQSITPPFKATSSDRQYYYIPFEDTKPCMHIKFPYQDHRRRLYLSNMLYKIFERLVSSKIQMQRSW